MVKNYSVRVPLYIHTQQLDPSRAPKIFIVAAWLHEPAQRPSIKVSEVVVEMMGPMGSEAVAEHFFHEIRFQDAS